MRTNFWGSQGTGSEHREESFLLGLAFVLIVMVLGTVPVWAQQITGSIAGTVKDEQVHAIVHSRQHGRI